MRQTQGSMICPSCGRLIGVNEPECPFCGAKNPSLFGYGPAMQRWFGRRFDLITMLVTACIVIYIVALALEPQAILHPRGGLFGLLSPGDDALDLLGMTSRYAMFAQHRWWTLFTAIFLHAGLLHIFFNLMWIRNVGPEVEEVYGPARAFVIFSMSGAIGFLVSNLASGTPTIGASGSIFGLLAALIVYGRRVGHSALTQQVWTWAIMVFIMGFLMSAVNNWAHAGGFAGGWIVAQAMPLRAQKREGHGIQLLALALIAVTAVGFGLSFFKVTTLLMGH